MHWIAPLIFTAIIGIANYAVYKSSIDYMIAAYGPYAASATGGNDFARDFLAGIAALYSHPCECNSVSVSEDFSLSGHGIVYENVGGEDRHLVYPSTILACLAVAVVIPIYVFYWKGPQIRLKSKFAQELEKARQARMRKKRSTVDEKGGQRGSREEDV